MHKITEDVIGVHWFEVACDVTGKYMKGNVVTLSYREYLFTLTIPIGPITIEKAIYRNRFKVAAIDRMCEPLT